MIFKLFWIVRGILYKPFFGKFCLPSYIGTPVFIKNIKRIYIGKNVRIFPGLRIEVIDNESSIVIEDNVSIGQNLHIISGRKNELKIGKNTTISANVFITNIDHDYKQLNIHILKQNIISKNTQIGEYCFIGYGAVILAGTILGKQCIVGTNSVVRGVFPDYSVIVGVPAKIIKRYNFKTNKWERTNDKGDFINE